VTGAIVGLKRALTKDLVSATAKAQMQSQIAALELVVQCLQSSHAQQEAKLTVAMSQVDSLQVCATY